MTQDTAYRPEIDGLRAIAVAAVVLYHAVPGLLPGGFVGVDIFFVISGYLITGILLRQWRDSGRIDFAEFYARRLRRLMPAMWCVVLASVLAALFLLPPLDAQRQQLSDSAVAALLYLANFHFQSTSGGYFDGPVDQLPLLHLWSLAVEEQYYLVYPALLWAALRWRPRALAGLLAGLGLASLLLAEHWLQAWPEGAFYQMPARFWELAAGALVAIRPIRAERRELSPWLPALGLVVLAGSVGLTTAVHFPGLGALPAVAGTVLVLLAIHAQAPLGVAGRLLAMRPMVALGLLSYSLYLWHWPLLAFDRATRLEPSPTWFRLALCLLALLLAWLTWRYVETPWRRGPAGARRVLAVGGVATAAMLAAVMGLGLLQLPQDERSQLMARTRADRPANMDACHHGANSRVQALMPAHCNSRPAEPATLVLWGDSHALAWQPFIRELAAVRGLSAASHTMDACAPVFDNAAGHARYPRHRSQCLRFNTLVRGLVAGGGIDTLVIAARWPPQLGEPSVPGDPEMALALQRTVREVAGQVRQVVLIAPTPVLRHEAPRCIGSRRPEDCAMSRAGFDAMAGASRRALAAAAAGLANVSVVDPADFFCTARDCPVVRDGYSLYWDDDHVSSTAARLFARERLATRPGWANAPAPARDASDRK